MAACYEAVLLPNRTTTHRGHAAPTDKAPFLSTAGAYLRETRFAGNPSGSLARTRKQHKPPRHAPSTGGNPPGSIAQTRKQHEAPLRVAVGVEGFEPPTSSL